MNRDSSILDHSSWVPPNPSSVSQFTTLFRPTRSLSRFSESNVPRTWQPHLGEDPVGSVDKVYRQRHAPTYKTSTVFVRSLLLRKSRAQRSSWRGIMLVSESASLHTKRGRDVPSYTQKPILGRQLFREIFLALTCAHSSCKPGLSTPSSHDPSFLGLQM